jgi:hypothetical protein
MPKKSKGSRPNIPEAALARARAELNGEVQVDTKPQNGHVAPRLTPLKAVAFSSGKTVTLDELRQDYTYVIADLRSMAMLAGVLFVGLIIVSMVVV